jgi:nicotinate-nucleotide adenylyltransferase
LRLGVLGGSFNPPHIGHLLIASDAFEALALDRLIVMPAFTNPLKVIDAGAPSASQRLEMTRLAFDGDSRFEVSSMEIDRGGLSYTVETLESLADRNPGAEMILLLGRDSVRSFDRWKRLERIRELARLALLTRGGEDVAPPEGVGTVTTRRIDVSSTEIRERLAAGKSIRGFVVASVERYIFTAKLYSSHASGGEGAAAEGRGENRNA